MADTPRLETTAEERATWQRGDAYRNRNPERLIRDIDTLLAALAAERERGMEEAAKIAEAGVQPLPADDIGRIGATIGNAIRQGLAASIRQAARKEPQT